MSCTAAGGSSTVVTATAAAEVVVLGVEPIEPRELVRPDGVLVHRLRQRDGPARVGGGSGRRQLLDLDQPLDPVGPQGLEHPEARLWTGGVSDQERTVDRPRQEVEGVRT